jgi:hypothetical protein
MITGVIGVGLVVIATVGAVILGALVGYAVCHWRPWRR